MTLPLLLALPWLALCLGVALSVRLPRPVPPAGMGGSDREELPPVSVIVPARDEEDVIGRCVESLVASRYPRFEVLVVDDRSGDRTGDLARAAGPGNADRFAVLDGEPLPEGWLGKPWACWQGFLEARGEILLFTDADTRHGPDLLERAVRALDQDRAGALSLMGRQLLETWWEKLVQPQVFTMIVGRFPDGRKPVEPGRCASAIANGQYILVRRGAYEDVGGHRAVRGEVVEDLQLARTLCSGGHRLTLRMAEDGLATRMYRTFPQMVEGWSKNLAIGTLQTLPAGVGRWALAGAFLAGVGLWLVPPGALAAGALSLAGPAVTAWAAAVSAVSALFWGAVSARMGVTPLWGLLYPVGSAIAGTIYARSALRGGRVEWKGRTYVVDPEGAGVE